MTYVQSFDTMLDEALLSLTKVPSEDIIGTLVQKQLHDSEALKLLMTLWLQDTV